MDPGSIQRKSLIDRLITEGFLKTPRVIKAFEKVPREEFVLPKGRDYAYADTPQGIGYGQTISAPHMVAIMTELLEPKPKDKVLEVGTGSGYQAAILSKLVKIIYTTELTPELVEFSRANLQRAGCKNVKVIQGDGSKGYPKEAPYDKIIVTCACPEIPRPLIEQLKQDGILIVPVGGAWMQDLKLYKKTKKDVEEKSYGGCVFVPLRH
jgi:protein-L-isoaspartate(D-aspartate) O-methyltransferase